MAEENKIEPTKPEDIAQPFTLSSGDPPPTMTMLGPTPASVAGPAKHATRSAEAMAKARAAKKARQAERERLAAQVPAVVDQPGGRQHANGAAPPGDLPKPAATRQRHVLRPLDEYPADEALNEKFHIPRNRWPSGYALQWEAYQVYNQPQNERQAVAMRVGWEPVYPEDFDGRFAYKVPYGWQGPIAIDGLMLMARSMEWDKHARARDKALAQNVINIRVRQLAKGELDRVTLDAQHKHLDKTNYVNASVDQVGVSGEHVGESK